ncbi:MAG TPA: uroporphyrinogen-III C-methyltransferase [Burkholderiaceae bacterium]|nr:uroporphyrinogen-III C-methyltransferase [Burkholderiaceae bacterium]
MTPEPTQDPATATAQPVSPTAPQVAPQRGGVAVTRAAIYALLVVAGLALAISVLLWQKLSAIQEQLARQTADSGATAVEARALAKQAQELARETAARQAVAEARVSEVTLQRTQLEELMQSLSRSRDENLVVDIESAIRLAQQQAQLTGSLAPMLAALKTADQRVARAAQPRLAPLQRAIARDIDRMKAASVTDTPGLLAKLDDLVRQVDDLPLMNAVAMVAPARGQTANEPPLVAWWERGLDLVRSEARKLLRVSRIEQPEAVLLSPEQSFFVRENLKLKLVNARLGLLARQLESARADLASASAALNKYFDPASRKTQAAAGLLQQVQGQMKAVELPRVDETLAALATAAAGR